MNIKDSKGREVEITGDYDIEAFHDGKRIGSIEFDDRDGDTTLIGMDVQEDYQRAGIATAMMREAADLHGSDFRKPSLRALGGKHASSDSYYTEEGRRLIYHCIALGILADTDVEENESD